MKKILCIAGIVLFGMSILIHTILTYLYAFSPYTLKMYACMVKNVVSIAGYYACMKLYLKQR